MSFRNDFARTPAGPQREALVYRAVLTQGKPTDLAPVTVNGPNGSKITYYVTKDFLNTDGVWLPMTGVTAQKVADYFGMSLPTPKMSKQIWQQADVQIRPTPLSSSGYSSGSQHYTPEQVVDQRIGASDAALAYSQEIANAKSRRGSSSGIVAGHMKDITQPPPSGNLGLYGWYGTDGKPIQSSYFTPHDTTQHTEYGSGVRLVDNNVIVQYPNGHTQKMTMDQLANSRLYPAVSDNPTMTKYNVSKDKANLASIDQEVGQGSQQVAEYQPEAPNSGRVQFLQRIDNFLSQFKNS